MREKEKERYYNTQQCSLRSFGSKRMFLRNEHKKVGYEKWVFQVEGKYFRGERKFMQVNSERKKQEDKEKSLEIIKQKFLKVINNFKLE